MPTTKETAFWSTTPKLTDLHELPDGTEVNVWKLLSKDTQYLAIWEGQHMDNLQFLFHPRSPSLKKALSMTSDLCWDESWETKGHVHIALKWLLKQDFPFIRGEFTMNAVPEDLHPDAVNSQG